MNDPIPETVDEALAKWDAGEPVFTVEMGGLGSGYEQAIQVLAFELMRRFRSLDLITQWEEAKAERDKIIDASSDFSGYTGAMVGAATNLAGLVVRHGYRSALRDDAVKDRLIQVSKTFTQPAARA